jgi:hypothetical protein
MEFAFVPELNPEMFSAQQNWVTLVREALATSKIRRARTSMTPALPPPNDLYATINLVGNMTTDSLAEQLSRSKSALGLVLLLQPGYVVRAAVRDDFLSAAKRLSQSSVAGFVSDVTMSDGSLLYPQPPYYLLASAWQNCGPEAPLLVKQALLLQYLQAYPGMTFRSWLFTLWLFYKSTDRQLLIRAPHAYFSFRGCFDSMHCFYSDEVIESPTEMLTQPRLFASREAPPGRIAARAHSFYTDYARLITEECTKRTGSSPDAVWIRAAAFPRLCTGTAEHGLFTLHALKVSLLYSCGAHCVFLPGELPEPPVSSLGWSLDAQGVCWREVGSHSHCAEWFPKRARMLPSGMDCATPPLDDITTSAAALAASAPCDFILSKEEHPPAGKCAPKILLAGFDGCGVREVAQLLKAHPHVNTSLSSGNNAVFTSRKAYYELDLTRASSLYARKTFAQQFADTDGTNTLSFDDTLAYMQTSPGLPSRLKRLMPSAKVVFIVCDPALRFWNVYNDVQVTGDKRKAELQRLLQKLDASSYDTLVATTLLDGSLGQRGVKKDALLLQQTFLERGYYALHLVDWTREFGAPNVLVVRAEDVQQATTETLARILEFSGLSQDSPPRLDTQFAVSPWEDAPPGSQIRLRALYARYNRWLADLLEDDYPLTWKASSA